MILLTLLTAMVMSLSPPLRKSSTTLARFDAFGVFSSPGGTSRLWHNVLDGGGGVSLSFLPVRNSSVVLAMRCLYIYCSMNMTLW
jgi:hypothetical protein